MGLFNLHKKPLSKALKTISHEQQQQQQKIKDKMN